jgi:hypothetical protein
LKRHWAETLAPPPLAINKLEVKLLHFIVSAAPAMGIYFLGKTVGAPSLKHIGFAGKVFENRLGEMRRLLVAAKAPIRIELSIK